MDVLAQKAYDVRMRGAAITLDELKCELRRLAALPYTTKWEPGEMPDFDMILRPVLEHINDEEVCTLLCDMGIISKADLTN